MSESSTSTNRSAVDPTRFHQPFEWDPTPIEPPRGGNILPPITLNIPMPPGATLPKPPVEAESTPDEVARLRRVVEAQKSALHEWRRHSEQDTGRITRYHAALVEIAHFPTKGLSLDAYRAVRDVQDRAARELEDYLCPRP